MPKTNITIPNRKTTIAEPKFRLKFPVNPLTGKIEIIIIQIVYNIICNAVFLSFFPVGSITKPAFL